MFTIQMRKYSPALPVNSGRIVRAVGVTGVLGALSMVVSLAGG
jgi:hypothetical protein